jgi:hypothetical protein
MQGLNLFKISRLLTNQNPAFLYKVYILLVRVICEKYRMVFAKSYLPFLPFTETLVTKFVKRYQLCVLCNNRICRFYPNRNYSAILATLRISY